MASLTPLTGSSPVSARTTEALLSEAVDARGPRATRLRQEAVVLSLPLADGLAGRYRHRGVDAEDLVQVARLALVKASLGYRPEVGTNFAAYATVTILGELKRHFRDLAWAVRPPRQLQEQHAALAATGEHLRHTLRRIPTTNDLATELGLAPDRVRDALACSTAYRAISLDITAPGGRPLCDTIPATGDDVETWETSATLATLVRGLTRREQRLLHLRFVEEQTQTEIGHALGVSQMQVSRLLSAVLRTLRAGMLGTTEESPDELEPPRAG